MQEDKVAFIIGNGTSRKDFDLNKLRGAGTIIGCNALYREFEPDLLVSIDAGIIEEILESDFPKDRFIVPELDECWEPADCNPNRPRSNAGMNAMFEAVKRGHNVLVCFGFDFLVWDKTQSVSNVYEGSQNYGPENKANFADNHGRIRYLAWFAKKNPTISLVFVFPPNYNLTTIPECDNILYVTYDLLIKNLHSV